MLCQSLTDHLTCLYMWGGVTAYKVKTWLDMEAMNTLPQTLLWLNLWKFQGEKFPEHRVMVSHSAFPTMCLSSVSLELLVIKFVSSLSFVVVLLPLCLLSLFSLCTFLQVPKAPELYVECIYWANQPTHCIVCCLLLLFFSLYFPHTPTGRGTWQPTAQLGMVEFSKKIIIGVYVFHSIL